MVLLHKNKLYALVHIIKLNKMEIFFLTLNNFKELNLLSLNY
jgi:hypothetical protein